MNYKEKILIWLGNFIGLSDLKFGFRNDIRNFLIKWASFGFLETLTELKHDWLTCPWEKWKMGKIEKMPKNSCSQSICDTNPWNGKKYYNELKK